MAFPDEVCKCVVFVGYRKADGVPRLAGTAFCVGREIEGTGSSFQYLVTARHVIDYIRNLGLDQVWLRLNRRSGSAVWASVPINQWLTHPEGPSVDVAVLHTSLGPETDHLMIPFKMVVTEKLIEQEKIGIGDEVFMTGLFSRHYGQQNNIPVVRVGNIAAMPKEKIETSLGSMDAYLIESRSIGGLSGSPVFVNLGLVRHGQLSSTGLPIFYLMGIVHGHFDVTENKIGDLNPVADDGLSSTSVNMGIAIVVPINKMLEVLNQPSVKEKEDSAVEQLRRKNLPVPDVAEQQDELQAARKILPGHNL
jgi:hypothetical protein